MSKSRIALLIILFVLSGTTLLIGALAKLEHWAWASQALMLGMALKIIFLIVAGVFLYQAVTANRT